jgi:hypothetical protein
MYTMLFSQELDNPLGLATISSADWPQTSDNWSDSTEYFATLVTNETFSLSYNFFAAPGIVPAQTDAQFKDGELRCAWCISLDVSDKMKATSPVLFTQNIDLTPQDLTGFQGLDPASEPFGERGAIVVTRCGSAFQLDKNTALGTNFNATGAANLVLYPKNGQH